LCAGSEPTGGVAPGGVAVGAPLVASGPAPLVLVTCVPMSPTSFCPATTETGRRCDDMSLLERPAATLLFRMSAAASDRLNFLTILKVSLVWYVGIYNIKVF
jgi:hypothetical protein